MAIETMTPEEYRKILAEAMTEKDLQAHVRRVAKVNGWRAFCWWSSQHSPAGWPDIVLVREVNEHQARMVFVECKKEGGKVTPEQEEVHRLLRLTRHGVFTWRPSSLLNGEIEEVLR
jgi:hypothetical protein